jgi:hypothetical protein
MSRNKKDGQIWISAILFMSLGIIVISLILAAAIPMIDRISDKNTLVSTKEIMLKIDDTIKTVANEGPGSQRRLDPLVIDKGELTILDGTYYFEWMMETESELMTKDIEVVEGSLYQKLNSTFVEEINRMRVWVTSNKINTTLISKFTSPFKGEYSVSIRHTGTYDPDTDNPVIEVTVT